MLYSNAKFSCGGLKCSFGAYMYFAGETDFGDLFSTRRRKRSAISYFFGEDLFAKMTPRPAARRHIFRVVVDDFYLICRCRIR